MMQANRPPLPFGHPFSVLLCKNKLGKCTVGHIVPCCPWLHPLIPPSSPWSPWVPDIPLCPLLPLSTLYRHLRQLPSFLLCHLSVDTCPRIFCFPPCAGGQKAKAGAVVGEAGGVTWWCQRRQTYKWAEEPGAAWE